MKSAFVFKIGFLALVLVFLVVAVSGLKAQLYQLEVTNYVDYWQTLGQKAKPPSQPLQTRIASSIEQSQHSLLPINPATWVSIGRVYYWYAIFADQQGDKAQTQHYLQQAKQAYTQQSEATPEWPYSYLLRLEVEAYQAELSDGFNELWQRNLHFARNNGQVTFALARQIPLLWSKLTPSEQKEALMVFYQAAVHSPQQASALVQLKHNTLTLLTATCILAKANQTPLNFCQ